MRTPRGLATAGMRVISLSSGGSASKHPMRIRERSAGPAICPVWRTGLGWSQSLPSRGMDLESMAPGG